MIPLLQPHFLKSPSLGILDDTGVVTTQISHHGGQHESLYEVL